MIEASAAGKLVISGEYAVLDGAPGIAVAVDVRASARVRVAQRSQLTVAGDGAWAFDIDSTGRLHWPVVPPAGQGRVLAAVWATLAVAGAAPAGPRAVTLDTRAFSRPVAGATAVKLGLGSSAAITAALTGVLLVQAGALSPERILAPAIAAHRDFQGGGSGIDVAAAVHGGVVALVPGAGAPRVRRLGWPAGLHALAAWTGTAAATPMLLARLAAFRARDAMACARALAPLDAAARAVLVAWEAADAEAVLASVAEFGRHLRAFDTSGDIGIWTPAHERLAGMARIAGALYKTSGAGGGDFGLALAASPGPIAQFAAACAAAGVLTVPVDAAVGGVQVADVAEVRE